MAFVVGRGEQPIVMIRRKLFYILLTVHIRIIVIDNQIDAQFLSMMCLFESSTCFEQPCAHPREDNCINYNNWYNKSVLVAVQYADHNDLHTGRSLTQSDYTRCCINTTVLLRMST